MRCFAQFGHTDFILCLGHRGRAVKDHFLDHYKAHSNDFVLSKGGREIEMVSSDISDWRMAFVDTGIDTSIGERLRRARRVLEDDTAFLANFGDVFTDAPLHDIISRLLTTDDVATMRAVRPQHSFQVLRMTADSRVSGIEPVADMALRTNGGYFVLMREIFNFLREGEDLVMATSVRAAASGRVHATPYDGFWAPVDTLKERAALAELDCSGVSPWALWRSSVAPRARSSRSASRRPVVDLPDVADPTPAR